MDRIVEIAKYSLVDIEDPVNLVPVVLISLCVFWSGRPVGLAWWAMFNGCLIHIYMDGIVGIFGRGPKWLVEQYGKLDVRYWQTQDPMVMTISAVEMVIMTPLCIIWYHSIVQKRWYCHAIAIMTSTFQLMGCIMYVGAEILDGFKHLPSNWPPRFDNFNDLFYFWFVFVCLNGVWVVVPVSIIVKSLYEMHHICSQLPPIKKKTSKRD
ncbi:probable 3-beta-hydroxysteroid-Delta(8),Delta(7)-isomerase [Actinia tenebrosa]|uniref:Probable 3-beta-hydroxysteroid-Delta(8),Delta(7)-isomerase n=1 Tax=Actinia tenebrosa TaxID=6105 RepID=A0A6P8HE87_ACTTE|nr:probable 3-beta-hydroxysteroid-Delta(8),Delta(7)-isomerase [Actinia tenebrosa]